jgi:hypothetical protein
MSRVIKVNFRTNYGKVPSIDVTTGEKTNKYMTLHGESSSEVDPIVKVEFKVKGADWNEITFELKDGSPYDVIFTYTLNFHNMGEGPIEISFRSFDGHEYSRSMDLSIKVPGSQGDPGLVPSLGPVLILLALFGVATLLSRRQRASSI